MMITEQARKWLSEMWLNHISWPFKKFKKSVSNLIQWFPVIWNDRDYDSGFIYEVLKFKINKQAAYMDLTDYPTTAKHMRVAAKIIDLVQNETYLFEWADYYETKYEFTPTENPDFFEMKQEVISERFSEYFNKYPNAYTKVVKPGMTKEHIAMEMSIHNHEKAKNLLFRILKNNIERWWV